MAPSSLGVLWKKLAHPQPENAEQGEKSAMDLFGKMLGASLWIRHGATKKGYQCYCPVIRCTGSLDDVYTCSEDGSDSVYPERLNRKALERYSASEARWENNTIVRDYDSIFLQCYFNWAGSGKLYRCIGMFATGGLDVCLA